MPKKPITWVGSIIILAAGIFCSWSLIQYRNERAIVHTQHLVLTAIAFIAPALAVLAIFRWYYFNERAK